MVSTSKILTVSYGTFSCTLEGFDDSFDTMKAIAEYFRDLAADDRYFGAEPPTPDADMLARIAEKEIARRVEAREDAGKIHLRAGDTPAIAPAPVAEPAPDVEPSEVDAPAQEPVVEVADAPLEAEEPADIPVDEPVLAEDVETAAEEIVEVEAPVEDIDTADVEDAAIIADVVEAATEADVAEEDATADDIEDNVSDAIAASVESAMAEEDAAPVEETVETAEAEVEATPEPVMEDAAEVAEDSVEEDDDSVAARLRRIRSVVARGSTGFTPDGFSEDEHAQDFHDDTVSDLDAALVADEPEAADMPERVTSQILDEHAHDDALAVLEETANDDASDFEDEASEIENLTEDTLSQLLADAMPEDALAETQDDLDAAPILEGEIEEDDLPEETQLRARVIKMKRSDFEAAVAEGGLEESFDVLEETPFDDEPAEAILSPEDEADLQSELDAVAAELEAEAPQAADADENAFADDQIEDELLDLAEDDTSDDEDRLEDEEIEQMFDEDAYDDASFDEEIPAKSRLLDQSDRPISRLFDEAQTHLDAPEATRRRSAIQHLRAAVEANQAETKAGSELRPGADEGAYRSDIEDVMRSSDPEDTVEAQLSEDHAPVTQPRSRRPIETRPAPLKLVAEQRVDTARDPVRPRRVSAAQTPETVELPQGTGSFSEFAEDIGANNLSELLEAAAAYMSDVEGRVQFSRPMLMGKLKEATREGFSREDSLKSFGQLLRNGKLQKLKGGRFTVTDETEFRANKRDAS